MSLTVVPASNGKFSFAIDSFYVESSGNRLHRRATISELQAHFQPHPAGSKSHDNVGHWYEAQLMHYGIPASKQKAVAKMRLFDAVQSGSLTVPGDIAKIERKMKREWAKKHKDATAGMNPAGDGQQQQQSAKNGKKRKREDESAAEGKRSQSKKSRSLSKENEGAKENKESKGKENKKAKESKESKEAQPAVSAEERPPRLKQTAPCSGRGGASAGRKDRASLPAQPQPSQQINGSPKTEQTARSRGAGASARGRGNADLTTQHPPNRTSG